MDEAFYISDPQSAQRFLRGFSHAVQIKGESCFRGARVQDLRTEVPGAIYSAKVRDGEEYKVYLEYDPSKGWLGQCTCAQEFSCEHLFAVMRALLVEHGAAMVRDLSSSRFSRRTMSDLGGNRKAQASHSNLSSRLTAALARPLNPEETNFVRKVTQTFERCRNTRHITHWDFMEMELGLGGTGWDAIEIWPAFPENELEFWLYVANAAQEHRVPIPDFMRPVSDLAEIQQRLAGWRRSREIEKWNKTLGKLALYASPNPGIRPALSQLRVVIEAKEARLQWHGPLHTGFETIKQNRLSHFASEYARGQIELDLEGELIWQAFSHRQYGGGDDRLRYTDPEATRILSRLFRLRQLENHLVDHEGHPLARPAEPLRWVLTAAMGPEDDYRLSLMQSDGTPHPPILCVLAGHPPLYLTPTSVYQGPPEGEHVLNTDGENRIPAPAIERVAGVTFLQTLGVELPLRLRDRVRTLAYKLKIKCELSPIHVGSKTEDCVFSVQATAADGHQQTWTGHNWVETTAQARRRTNRNDHEIIRYDQAALEIVRSLLAPLSLRPSAMGWTLVTRVNKKFPELFSSWLKTVPQDIVVELAGELASFAEAAISGKVKLEVSEAAIDWFDLRVVLDVSDTTLTPAELKLLLNARGGYVRLAGKGWRRLHYDLSEDENERLARLGLSPRELSAEPQRLHALQLADEAAKKFLPEQQVAQIQRRASELKARVTPNLPLGVTAQLRPYQLEGFHFLAYLATNRFGGILADDMGLGKTLQTLAWLVWLREQGRGDLSELLPSLVVCPKSVMDNWHAEAARFTPDLRVRLWAASELVSFKQALASADLHVLNYSQLRLMGENLTPLNWLAVILDEGQYVKNPNSQTAQVARSLRAQNRLVLSGTPIENRLLDLWSLMAFAMPGVLSSRAEFARLYDGRGDPLARRRLGSRVRPFLMRRTKAQVAKDLPDRIEEDLCCEIEGEQQTLYRAELKRAQQLLLQVKTQKEVAEHQLHFLTSLLRLRQICCHPSLVNPGSTAASAKLEALFELLEPLMEEGQKVLVFSQFVELLALLKPAVAEREWPMFYLAGDTENRGELVRQFQATEGPAVFLISLKAGGFGLNLTAASYVVLFDPWWNPAVENQAIDRTHRIGQVNKVIAYRLLIKNSIEEKIRELQKQKKALAEDVFGEERFSQSLTLQDLQFLFAD